MLLLHGGVVDVVVVAVGRPLRLLLQVAVLLLLLLQRLFALDEVLLLLLLLLVVYWFLTRGFAALVNDCGKKQRNNILTVYVFDFPIYSVLEQDFTPFRFPHAMRSVKLLNFSKNKSLPAHMRPERI